MNHSRWTRDQGENRGIFCVFLEKAALGPARKLIWRKAPLGPQKFRKKKGQNCFSTTAELNQISSQCRNVTTTPLVHTRTYRSDSDMMMYHVQIWLEYKARRIDTLISHHHHQIIISYYYSATTYYVRTIYYLFIYL